MGAPKMAVAGRHRVVATAPRATTGTVAVATSQICRHAQESCVRRPTAASTPITPVADIARCTQTGLPAGDRWTERRPGPQSTTRSSRAWSGLRGAGAGVATTMRADTPCFRAGRAASAASLTASSMATITASLPPERISITSAATGGALTRSTCARSRPSRTRSTLSLSSGQQILQATGASPMTRSGGAGAPGWSRRAARERLITRLLTPPQRRRGRCGSRCTHTTTETARNFPGPIRLTRTFRRHRNSDNSRTRGV